MIHQFDHRWASYQTTDDGKLDTANVALADKQNPNFTVRPRYYVKTREVLARIAHVPKSVAAAYADPDDHSFLLVSLANWVDAGREKNKIFESSDDSLRAVISLAGNHYAPLLQERGEWKNPKIHNEAQLHPPLNEDELNLLRESRDLWQAMDILRMRYKIT
jgi:hypothetical protein